MDDETDYESSDERSFKKRRSEKKYEEGRAMVQDMMNEIAEEAPPKHKRSRRVFSDHEEEQEEEQGGSSSSSRAPPPKRPAATTSKPRSRSIKSTAKEPAPEPVTVQYITKEDGEQPDSEHEDEEPDTSSGRMVPKRKRKERPILTAMLLAPGDPLTNLSMKFAEQVRERNLIVHRTQFALPFADIWFVEQPTEQQKKLFGEQKRYNDIFTWMYDTDQLAFTLLVERKVKESDLIKSIIDRERWQMQRDRMIKSNVRTILFAEGKIDCPMTISLYRNCALIHGIFVLHTPDTTGSFIEMMEIGRMLNKGSDLKVHRNVIKMTLTDQRNEWIMAHMLAVISQVSLDAGMAIQIKYKTMRNLITCFDACPTTEDKELMIHRTVAYRVLKDATCIAPDTEVGIVPINKPTSAKIYNCIYNPGLVKPDPAQAKKIVKPLPIVVGVDL